MKLDDCDDLTIACLAYMLAGKYKKMDKAVALDKVEIWCDGACSRNPGPSAWAAVLICGTIRKEFSGYLGIGTNNSAEVYAAAKALAALKRPCDVTIYSDSRYLIEGAQGAWNITTNSEAWAELEYFVGNHLINWQWVKGHSGLVHNERANLLANNLAYKGEQS